MSKISSKLRNFGAVFASVLAAAVALPGAAYAAHLPAEHRLNGGVGYVSGGIGDDEALRFKAAARDFPLVIELFRHDGKRDDYTADARVTISDANGHVVLNEQADGPFMLVRLPAGHYTVSSSLDGRTLPAQHVSVAATGSTRSVFVFPG